MDNSGKGQNKSMRRAKTAAKLAEMLREIDISAAVGSEGTYSASARITALFDHGTFSRIGAYINRSADPDEPVGVICGYGAVGGRLVYAFAQDRARMKGAFDSATGKLICDLYAMAVRNGAPIVGIFDSDGVCVYEGVRALASLGKTMSVSGSATGLVPRIALVPGVCGGSTAVMASAFDFLLSVKPSENGGSDIYAVSPFVNGVTPMPAREGISAYEAEDEAELYRFARDLISFFPSNNSDGTFMDDNISDAELQRAPDITGLCGESLISVISDGKKYVRLFEKYAPELAVGFATVGGINCAFLASDRANNDGCLSVAACRVAARIQKFADSFGMPLVSFVDCPGFDNNETNTGAYFDAAAAMSDAMCFSSNAKISVVIGRAYGAGFIYMASKICGADIAYALPDSCISALSPEASVALVWNDRVRERDLSSTREMLELEWREKLASPNDAALCGEIDDIIKSTEVRPRVVSALHMLLGKAKVEPSRRKR